jgi:ATP-dependent RNA helicase DeaD
MDSSLDTFASLGLHAPLVQALTEVGYETPTPIQLQTIPLLLAGGDVIGQAQTGTGKTAAFALPILQKLDLQNGRVQALILTPTRELTLQVAEALHTYAKHLGRVRTTPIYGGDSMSKQINRLRGGTHIVVGTPGRVMDHLRRGTLEFSALRWVVLDEADEMLRMGFLEDVEWILGQATGQLQIALFSATMPRAVRRIADRYLKTPATVEIQHKTLTVPTVAQYYVQVSERQKLEALTHLLEAEASPGEANLVFVRTKIGAADLAERLEARGYAVEAMHGDMNQAQRESVIRRMRAGQVELVVATDVAARGLDVEHISRVINFDIPNDPESYVHRIGRTARAGRAGQAVLFLTHREMPMMREIEKYTGQRLTLMKTPTHADVTARRRTLFKERLLKALQTEELAPYISLIEELTEESDHALLEIAAAAAWLARGAKPITAPVTPPLDAPLAEAPLTDRATGTVMLYINAGWSAKVRPADLVGAIANETGVPGKHIGPIEIADDFSLVGVPADRLDDVLAGMAGAKIRGQIVAIKVAAARDQAPPRRGRASASSAKAYAPAPARPRAGRAEVPELYGEGEGGSTLKKKKGKKRK